MQGSAVRPCQSITISSYQFTLTVQEKLIISNFLVYSRQPLILYTIASENFAKLCQEFWKVSPEQHSRSIPDLPTTT
ncbi:hypothetical protein LENED_010593 [Lentinula edodes]|uniref:Uncharacterized protein n=1 Tax=Lentinula edodes TaxID=5353 RepID=A0A1Q3EMW4_LENED|nr:hypothetical protein LENED_010593 [Lentinula edodes]